MQKILILGGTGFIGGNISSHLINKGKKVTVFDRNNTNHKIEGVRYIVGECKNNELLDQVLEDQDIVIHLANSILPKTSMQNPSFGYQLEITNAINLLDLCLKNNVGRVIFASSGGTVYGNNGVRLNTEDSPTRPINHYGNIKLAIENIMMMYNNIYGMNNIVLRVSNPYGIGQNMTRGIGVITAFILRILQNEELQIYGDGCIVRDYVSIKDVNYAFTKACDVKIDNTYPIFNIGSGIGFSINQILEIIINFLNIQPVINYLPKREFDVPYSVLDIQKATKYLGYMPKVKLIEGIHKYISYIQSSLLSKRSDIE